MLEVQGINQYYGDSHILWDVDLQVKQGSRTALIGRNGVGKSTLAKSILGLTPIRDGRIQLASRRLEKLPSWDRVRSGISYVPQGRGIFPRLTVEENLRTAIDGREIENSRVFDYFPILKTFRNRRGGNLSGGQQQQLAIARAILQKPRILILDEPTEGIQPNIVDRIGEVLVDLCTSEDLTILTIEQKIAFVKSYHDHFYIMDKGRIVLEGPIEQLDGDALNEHLLL